MQDNKGTSRLKGIRITFIAVLLGLAAAIMIYPLFLDGSYFDSLTKSIPRVGIPALVSLITVSTILYFKGRGTHRESHRSPQ